MSIKPVDFQYHNNIKVISKKQFDIHMTLYKDYVKKVNDITKELATNNREKESANSTYSIYRGLKKGENYAIDATILHELYFQNIGGISHDVGKKTLKLFDKYFGGFDNWKHDFIACAKSARGWCVLAFEQRTDSLRNFCQDSHDEGIITSAFPILVIDLYEHAYYIDYANRKNDYINNFIENINWTIVEKRLNNL